MGINNTSSETSNNYLFEDQNIFNYHGLKTSFTEKNQRLDNYYQNNFDTQKQ